VSAKKRCLTNFLQQQIQWRVDIISRQRKKERGKVRKRKKGRRGGERTRERKTRSERAKDLSPKTRREQTSRLLERGTEIES
jgi:hypothetical protein